MISRMTLKRLPMYLRILKQLKKEKVVSVSSTTIANELKLNPIQVRKDLAQVYKADGKPGVGFDVDDLIRDIEKYLDLNLTQDVIIVGAGRLGQALMNYKGFENAINISMAFDLDESKCDNEKIYPISRMEELIKAKKVKIAIITVPKEEAQKICDDLISFGIKVIWNFAPINLKVPDSIKIKNEDLSASLTVLLSETKTRRKKSK